MLRPGFGALPEQIPAPLVFSKAKTSGVAPKCEGIRVIRAKVVGTPVPQNLERIYGPYFQSSDAPQDTVTNFFSFQESKMIDWAK